MRLVGKELLTQQPHKSLMVSFLLLMLSGVLLLLKIKSATGILVRWLAGSFVSKLTFLKEWTCSYNAAACLFVAAQYLRSVTTAINGVRLTNTVSCK